MNEEQNAFLNAAKSAYLKLDKEDDRLAFIDWCRRENDRKLFGKVREAADEAEIELNSHIDSAKKIGEKLHAVGGEWIDSANSTIKSAASNLESLMNDILNGGKKDGK